MSFPLTYESRLVSGTVSPLEGVNVGQGFWCNRFFIPQKLNYLHYLW